MQRNLPRVITLGKNAHQLAARHDEQCADVFFGHQLDGVKDRSFRRNVPKRGGFVVEDGADGVGGFHRSETFICPFPADYKGKVLFRSASQGIHPLLQTELNLFSLFT